MGLGCTHAVQLQLKRAMWMAVGAPVESVPGVTLLSLQATPRAGIQLLYKQQCLALIAAPIQGLGTT